jgi:hypothetical protein
MTTLLPLLLFSPAAGPAIDFNRDVRPILADHCYQCHGPDAQKRKGDLRLDVDPTADKRDTPLVVPGKPDGSELIRRVAAAADDMDRMPPINFGRQLSKKQIEILKLWVAQGGKWDKHWAYVAPKSSEIPRTQHKTANPIDAFVFAKLEKEGLSPSPEADRTKLIRRLSFDLNGLPPTPAEVDAFVADKSPDAVAKLVDRLLASPRYGERMAWRWLEAARYADTNGYQTDAERHMWRWRDWVIEAYNRNLPFDQFTIEQLAGDMLPGATLDQRIATGFNRNHRGNSEGGIVPEEYAVEYVVDRVETTATVWLGMTAGCARCHDHKYDPLSQKEFYRLYAYFNNVPEKGRAVKFGNSPPLIKVPTREQEKKLAEADAYLRELEERWARRLPEVEKAEEAFATSDNPAKASRYVAGYGAVKSWSYSAPLAFDGEKFTDAGDLGDFGYDDRFSVALRLRPLKASGALVSRGPDEPQAEGYSVELVDGKVRVSLTKRWLDDALRVETAKVVAVDRSYHLAVTYDGSRSAAGVKIYLDGILQKTTVLLDELNQTFQNNEPFRIGAGGGKDNRFRGFLNDIGLYFCTLGAEEVAMLADPSTLGEIAAKKPAARTVAERDKLRRYAAESLLPEAIGVMYYQMDSARHWRMRFWDKVTTTMVMEEMPTPRDAFVLLRGEYDKKGEKVTPGVPAALGGTPKNRLEFAKWLVDGKNPLTARVAVNRMWQLHFGKGLVRTGEDFGTQGEYPTHPELLDWLAVEFARDWDIKRLHKLIVTSATYRQSSRVTKELLERDPDNKLLARGPRLRLSAEMIRDQALFASGLLVEKLGGPSVKPYQPAGLWNELSGTGDYTPDRGENLYRRSLYTYWKRSVPPPTLGVFDTSMRETCWVRETRTNTPLHALTLLNDVTFVEAARVLAQRVMKDDVTAEKRIAKAFKLLTARAPTDAEAKVLLGAYERQLASYRKNPAAAAKLLRVGEAEADDKLDAAELAALANVCSLILNLDEVVTKE